MNRPEKMKRREPLSSLTGIKSSLASLRSVVSLTYLLYLVNDKKASISYSEAISENAIQIKNEYLNKIIVYLNNDNTIGDYINENPLFKSQIESLYVGVTLMFGLGRVSFEDSTLAMTKERTGGKRFPKVIDFASNIITLDIILSGLDDDDKKTLLLNWLKNNPINDKSETMVSEYLNICIENNLFKLRIDSEEDLFFQTEGIYNGILTNDIVSLEGEELVGPTRILKNMISEGLSPWLKIDGNRISYKSDSGFDIVNYSKILKTSLDIRDICVDNPMQTSSDLSISDIEKPYNNYLAAIKTKPFLLLAGISGTGKSRIVRELAFMTCPSCLQDKDGTSPGNYCMIEVKPNWHDSTELLGYWSNINKKYIFPKFIQFLVKAKMYPTVPFFVCLDEMNLAPVEQYFAEILSILETRRHPKGEGNEANLESVKTEVIVDKKYFKSFATSSNITNVETGEGMLKYKNDREIYLALHKLDSAEEIDENAGSLETLLEEGLKLPDNVFIIGTVNMDDTTHQFSRKVIDRAMTIEMNGGDLHTMFGNDVQLTYREDSKLISIEKVQPKYVSADEALMHCPTLRDNPEFSKFVKGQDNEGNRVDDSLPQRLENINNILAGTPFTVSYRVMNELVIMLAVLCDEVVENNEIIDENKFKTLMEIAFDKILLMKILPRVEGDDEMFRISAKERKTNNLPESVDDDGDNYDFTKLDWLKQVAPQRKQTDSESATTDETKTYMAIDKLDEMIARLHRQNFTRYWP